MPPNKWVFEFRNTGSVEYKKPTKRNPMTRNENTVLSVKTSQNRTFPYNAKFNFPNYQLI